MDFGQEIKKPSLQSNPDYITGKTEGRKSYKFECTECGNKLKISFQRQIKFHWIGKTNSISETEHSELIDYYGIGLSKKSHDGGFPVFDKISCKNCKQEYFTYSGVREFNNSAYIIYIQGIQKLVKSL